MAKPRRIGTTGTPKRGHAPPTPPKKTTPSHPSEDKPRSKPPPKPPGAFRNPETAPFKPGTLPFKQRQAAAQLETKLTAARLNSLIPLSVNPQPQQIASRYGLADPTRLFADAASSQADRGAPQAGARTNMPHLTERVALAKARQSRLKHGGLDTPELAAGERRASQVLPTQIPRPVALPPGSFDAPPPKPPPDLRTKRAAGAPAGAHPEQSMAAQPPSHTGLFDQITTGYHAAFDPLIHEWNAVRPYTPAAGIEGAVKGATPGIGKTIGNLDVIGAEPYFGTIAKAAAKAGEQLGYLHTDNATKAIGEIGLKGASEIQRAGDADIGIPAAQAGPTARKRFPGQKVITEADFRQLQQEQGGLGGLPHDTRTALIDKMVRIGWPRQDAIKMVDSDVIHYSGNAPSPFVLQWLKNAGSFASTQANAPAGILAIGDAGVRALGGNTKPIGKIGQEFIGGTANTLPAIGDRPWYDNLYWHPGEFLQNFAWGVGTADSLAGRFSRFAETPREITPDGFQQPISRGYYSKKPLQRGIEKVRDKLVQSENPVTNFIPHFGGLARRRAIAKQDYADFTARTTHPIQNAAAEHQVAVLHAAQKIGKHRVAALNSMLQGSDPLERAAFYRSITSQVGAWRGRGAAAHARVSDTLTDQPHITADDQAYIDAVRAAATFATEVRAGAGQFSLNLAARYRIHQEPIQIAYANGDPLAQDLLAKRDYWLGELRSSAKSSTPSAAAKTATAKLQEIEREIKKHEKALERLGQTPEQIVENAGKNDIGPRPTKANALAARRIQETEARAADPGLTDVQRARWEQKAAELRAKFPDHHPARVLAMRNDLRSKPIAGGAPDEVRNIPEGATYLGQSPVTNGHYIEMPNGEIARSQTGAGPWRFESTAAGWRDVGRDVVFPKEGAPEPYQPPPLMSREEAMKPSPFKAPPESAKTPRQRKPTTVQRDAHEAAQQLGHEIHYPKLYKTEAGAGIRAQEMQGANTDYHFEHYKVDGGWRVKGTRDMAAFKAGDEVAWRDGTSGEKGVVMRTDAEDGYVFVRFSDGVVKVERADLRHYDEVAAARSPEPPQKAAPGTKGTAARLRDMATRERELDASGEARSEGDPNLEVRYVGPRLDAQGKEIPNAEGHFDWGSSYAVYDKSGKEVFRGGEQDALEFKGDTRMTERAGVNRLRNERDAAQAKDKRRLKPDELTPTVVHPVGGHVFGGVSRSLGIFPSEAEARAAGAKWVHEYEPSGPHEIEPHYDVYPRGSGKSKRFELIARTRDHGEPGAREAEQAATLAEAEKRFGPFRPENDGRTPEYDAMRERQNAEIAAKIMGKYEVSYDAKTKRWFAHDKDNTWRSEPHKYKDDATSEARSRRYAEDQAAAGIGQDNGPQVGDPVAEEGGRRGKITRVNPDGSFMVLYDGTKRAVRHQADDHLGSAATEADVPATHRPPDNEQSRFAGRQPQYAPLAERDPLTKKWRANYSGDGTKTPWFKTKREAEAEAANLSPSEKLEAVKAKAPKGLGPERTPEAERQHLEGAISRANRLGDKEKAAQLKDELKAVLNKAPARTREEQGNVGVILAGGEPTKTALAAAEKARKRSDALIGAFKVGDDVQMKGSAGVVPGKIIEEADNGDLLVDFGDTFGGVSRVPPGELEYDIAKPKPGEGGPLPTGSGKPPGKPPTEKKAPAAPGEPPPRRSGVPTVEEAVAQHELDLAAWKKAKRQLDAAEKRTGRKTAEHDAALRRLRRRADTLRLRADQSAHDALAARNEGNQGDAGEAYSGALDAFIAQHEARPGTTTPVFIPQEVPQTLSAQWRNRNAGKAMPKERVPRMRATQDRLILSGDYRSTAAGIANEARRAALVQARIDLFNGVKAEYASQPVGGQIADPSVVYVKADALDTPVDLEHTVGMHNITDEQVASAIERARTRLESGVIDVDKIGGFLPDDTSEILQIPRSIYEEIHSSVQPYDPGSFALAYDTLNRGYQRFMLSKPSTGISNIAGNPILAMMGGASPWEATWKGYQLAKHPEWLPPQLLEGGLASQLRQGQAYTPIGKWVNYSLSKQRASEQAARAGLYHHLAGKHVARQAAALDMTADEVLRRMASGQDPTGFELARKVEQFLGDMKRSKKFGVGFERGLGRSILFHRWLGHILTLALYTLPVKYPGRALLLQRISEIGDDYRKHHGIFPSWYVGMLPLMQHIVGGKKGEPGALESFTRALPTGSIWPTSNLPIPLGDEQGANPLAFAWNSANPIVRSAVETALGYDISAMKPYKDASGNPVKNFDLNLGAALAQRATPYMSYLYPAAGRGDTAHVGDWYARVNKNVHGRPLPPGYGTSAVPYGGNSPSFSWQYGLGLASRLLVGGSGVQNIPSHTRGTEYRRIHTDMPLARAGYNTEIKKRARARLAAAKKKKAHH